MKTFYYIYQTTNLINNKKYIGRRKFQGNNIENDTYIGSGKILKSAVKKYGIENFEKFILYICNSEDEMYFMEECYTRVFNTVEDPLFYNICYGGKKSGGYLIEGYSDEEKSEIHKKISNAIKGSKRGPNLKHSKYMKEKWSSMPQKDKNELIQPMIQAAQKREWTDEERNKKSKQMKGKYKGKNNPFYGKTHTKEQKQKWSKNRKEKIPWNKGKTGLQKWNKERHLLHQKLVQKNIKGTIWVNNGNINKRVKPEKLNDFLLFGWVQGMIVK